MLSNFAVCGWWWWRESFSPFLSCSQPAGSPTNPLSCSGDNVRRPFTLSLYTNNTQSLIVAHRRLLVPNELLPCKMGWRMVYYIVSLPPGRMDELFCSGDDRFSVRLKLVAVGREFVAVSDSVVTWLEIIGKCVLNLLIYQRDRMWEMKRNVLDNLIEVE